MVDSSEKEKTYRSVKDLLLWQHAIELAQFIYLKTLALPADAQRMAEEIQHSSSLVPQYFAIGYSLRYLDQDSYIRKIKLVIAELARLETQWQLMSQLGLVDDLTPETTAEFEALLTNLRKLTFGVLRKQLERRKEHLPTDDDRS